MSRRTGGRRARLAQRGVPLEKAARPVQAGEKGGQFKPLSDTDLDAITGNVFKILAEVGFADATPHCIETCTGVGAILGDDGRLRMPEQVVEAALQMAQK
ncbi:MAG: methyltransferase, partial [Gammaproteobacteria bacterium]|nr:methyltransferase [Gammaproteobacteria bacterium]